MLQLGSSCATSTWLGNVQDDLGNTGQDFTLFLSEILYPDFFQLWSNTPKIWDGCIQQRCWQQLLRGAGSLCPLSIVWLHLGSSWFLQRFGSAHLELCSAPPAKEYIYSQCKDKYLPEFISNSTTGKLFKNNNNNNNKETSQEIKEWVIPLPGLIYFYSSNNKEIGNEWYFLFSAQYHWGPMVKSQSVPDIAGFYIKN